MSNPKLKIAVALACVLLVAFVTSTWAVEYNPGVSVGQWVKYGNIVAIGTGLEDLNETDWAKVEVTAVSGKNITLRTTGKYKNGTDIQESTMICNVETGWMNATTMGGYTFVIAANLQEGDTLPAPDTPLKINKTETRTYMSVSRSVNIFNMTMSVTGYYDYKLIFIWDKASGMLLEMEMEMTTTMPTPTTSKMSAKAVDTNIFATGAAGWLMDNIIYIVIAIIVVIVVIAAIVIIRRKKQ